MVEITAQMVKQLRDKTNVGMMDCKAALTEASGDMEKSIELLRKKGMAVAAKRSGKAANQGLIASRVSIDGKIGVLVEVNAETDFVARNEIFQAFVNDVAAQIETGKPKTVDELLAQKSSSNSTITVQDTLSDIIAKITENIKIRRMERIEADEKGTISDYIHMGGKIGVLLKVAFDNPETASMPEVKEMLRDLCMQVAASSPEYIQESDISADIIEKEKEIHKAQIKNKPEHIIDK